MKSFAVLALSLVATVAAHAAPITGQFSITGTSVSDNGSVLSFNPASVNVGAADTLYGSFQSLLTAGEAGSMSSSINYSNYVPDSTSIVFTNSNDTVTFTLDSISKVSSGMFGNFTGMGTITTNLAGYDATPANLYFSTQANGNVTFSATAISTSPVPEPSTLALLGTGLVGAAGAARRKFLGA